MKGKRKAHHKAAISNKNVNIITINQPSALKRYIQRHQRVAPVRSFMGTFPVSAAPSYLNISRPKEPEGISVPPDFKPPAKDPTKPPTVPPTIPPTVPPTLPPTEGPTLPPPPPPPPPIPSPVKVDPTIKKDEDEEPWWLKGLIYGGSALALTGLGLAGSEFSRSGEQKYDSIRLDEGEGPEGEGPEGGEPDGQGGGGGDVEMVQRSDENREDGPADDGVVRVSEELNKGTGNSDDNKEAGHNTEGDIADLEAKNLHKAVHESIKDDIATRISRALDAHEFLPSKRNLSSAVTYNKELKSGGSPTRLKDLQKAIKNQVRERKGSFKRLYDGEIIEGSNVHDLYQKFINGDITLKDLKEQLNNIKAFEASIKFARKPAVPPRILPPEAFVKGR